MTFRAVRSSGDLRHFRAHHSLREAGARPRGEREIRNLEKVARVVDEMSFVIKPIEETEEYAVAVEDETPLAALLETQSPSARRAIRHTAAAHACAVSAIELFVLQSHLPPTESDRLRLRVLLEREADCLMRRNEAFAEAGFTT